MRFTELPIVQDPYAQDVQTFNWRSRKGLIKTHSHWARAPDRQEFYFDGSEIVTVDENPANFNWIKAFANHYGLWNSP